MTSHEWIVAIHAHSIYSDGSGTVEEIIQAGQDAGLDVLILTDHNTLEARERGYEGWHDRLLLIVGDEVSSRQGHCISLGTQTHVDHKQSLHGILQDIHDQDGLSFIAHPYGKARPLLKTHDHSWKDWSADSMTGLELWSYMFDWASTFHYTRFPRYYQSPDDYLTGPNPATVRKWDELCQRKRVVAFGGVDAHAKSYPILPWVVFPYEMLFGTIRTHLLLDTPPTGDATSDIESVLTGLAAGQAFLTHDGRADSKGTRFGTLDGNLSIGHETTFEGPVELMFDLPLEAQITLLCNGRPIRHEVTNALKHDVEEPGIYRIEATLGDRPWLYTNPIYLREQPDSATA
ncbi:MAG: hypothetical protein CME19_18850 [Gemmatimonadetes bacterium]|nr:hypothetical protein [Gemmatimonadota bacterium]